MSKTQFDTELFYNYGDVFSRNGVYNFIVGGRGIGKTYGAKEQAIRNYLKRGEQFIYLRRYNTELKTRSTFFADVMQEFPGFSFRVMGSEAQVCRDPNAEKQKWETMGYFIALSNAQSKKSVAYPKVTLIIFDEFIIEKGVVRYLDSEARVMNDFYSTVDRYQNRTRVLFLANSVSIMNPYFLEYKIRPDGREWMKAANGFIVCHFPDDEEFSKAIKETRFGQFIAGTEYEEYAVGNQFRDNSDAMIGTKTPESTYFFTLETEEMTFSIWRSMPSAEIHYYVQEKRPGEEIMFTIVAEQMSDEKVLLHYSDKLMKLLRSAFKRGRVIFDSPSSRNAFIEIFKH